MADTDGKTREEKLKKCFVIMPISDVDGYPKGHFDRVYEFIIKPACMQAGFDAIRADVTAKTNVIIVDILKHVYDCEMAICDLSARNPNVFYELGFRQAFNKKTVLMIDEKTTRPFDISAIRSFQYQSSLRIDLVNEAKEKLTKALMETETMEENETNSLLKLLSIESPAKLPQSLKLSDDSSLILQAIRDLGDEIQRNFRKNRHSPVLVKPNLRRFTLPNGERVKVGDHLYDTLNNREFGEVIDITDNNMVVNNNKGSVEFVKLEQAEHLVTMPF